MTFKPSESKDSLPSREEAVIDPSRGPEPPPIEELLGPLVNHERDQRFHQGEIDYGLENFVILMDSLGNPHRDYPTIHVAGSYGKGTVSIYSAASLRASGYRVGLYMSPHLLKVEERIRLNGEMIDETVLRSSLLRVIESAKRLRLPLTYFEAITAAAFCVFAEQEVDVAVIEVGLGGRLDATNVIEGDVAVITAIGADHRKILGSTPEQIASEKAGIIKCRQPVVLGEFESSCRRVFDHRIAAQDAEPIPLLPLKDDGVPSPMRLWAALARTAAKTVAERSLRGLSDQPCRLDQVLVPGRFQELEEFPRTLLDGGHMPEAIEAAIVEARLRFGMKDLCMILGLLADKESTSILAVMSRLSVWPIFTQVPSPRAANPSDLMRKSKEFDGFSSDPLVIDDPRLAWERAHETLGDRGAILISGSFYLSARFLTEKAIAKLF